MLKMSLMSDLAHMYYLLARCIAYYRELKELQQNL